MVAVWLAVVVLLLVPGIAAGQIGTLPTERRQPVEILPTLPPGLIYDTPRGMAPVDVSPEPPTVVPSGPRLRLPSRPRAGVRPRGLFQFRPTLGVSEEYTDNFRLTEDNKESNFRTQISPGLQVFVDSATLTGSGEYTLGAFYDTARDTEPTLHHALAASFTWRATPRFRLSLSEAFVRHDDPVVADSLETNRNRENFTSSRTSLLGSYEFDLTTARGSYRYSHFARDSGSSSDAHRLGTRVSRQLGASNEATFGYEYLVSDSVNNGRTTRVNGHELRASFSRELTSYTTGGISTSYAIRDEERSGGGQSDSSFNRANISLFGSYRGPQLTVRASLGVGLLTESDDQTGDSTFRDPMWTTTTTITYWSGPATITIDLERGFSETFGETDDNGVVQTTGIRATFTYEFSTLLEGRLFGAYRLNEFTGVGTSNAARGDETIVTFGAGLRWEIASWLDANFEVEHRRDNSSSRPFTENRVRVSLRATFY